MFGDQSFRAAASSSAVNSRLDAIAIQYRILSHGGSGSGLPVPTSEELPEHAQHAIRDIDERGAWTDLGDLLRVLRWNGCIDFDASEKRIGDSPRAPKWRAI